MSVRGEEIIATFQGVDNLTPVQQKLLAEFQKVKAEATQTGAQFEKTGQSAVEMGGHLTTASKHADGLSHQLAEVKVQAAEAGKELAGALAPGIGSLVISVVGLAAALGEAIKMLNAEEVATARLAQSLHNNIPNFDGNTEAIERFASAQKKLGFEDEATKNSISTLVVATHDVGRAMDLASLAMDVARGRHMSLEAATTLLMRVQTGHLGILARYGIEIKAGATATEALAALQERYSGQAEAYSHTTAGAIDRLKIAWDDAMKTAAAAVLPTITKLVEGFADMLPKVVSIATAVTDTLGPAFKLLGMILEPIGVVLGTVADALSALHNPAADAGAAIDEDFAKRVQSGMLTAQGAVTDGVAGMTDTFAQGSQDAQAYGTDTGEGFGQNTSAGIDSKLGDISDSAGSAVTSMDKSDDAGTLGENVGVRYGSGTPGGVAPGIRSTKGDVSNAASEIVGAMDKRGEAAATGMAVGQAYGINLAASAIASAATMGIDITGKHVAGPSGFMIPNLAPIPHEDSRPPPITPYNPDYETPYAPGGGPNANKGYGPGYGAGSVPGGGQPTDEEIASAKAKGGGAYVPPAKKLPAKTGGKKGGAGPSAASQARAAAAQAKAADNAADSSRGVDNSLAEARAKAAVTAAQDNLNNITDKYKKQIDDLEANAGNWANAEKASLGALQGQMDQAQAALDDFRDHSQRDLQAMGDKIDDDTLALKRFQEAEEVALQPLADDVKRATDALADLQAQTAAADEMFARMGHTLADRMYEVEGAEKAAAAPFDEQIAADKVGLEALGGELEAVNAKYAYLNDLKDQLNELDREQQHIDNSKKLHDEAVSIDNLVARLATATGAEREQLQAQLDTARKQNDLDTKKAGLSERIADVEAQKKAEVDAVNARIHAAELQQAADQKARDAALATFEERKKNIADEQALLDHQRAEYDYEQHQKELAAQAEVTGAQNAYDARKKYYDDIAVARQKDIDAEQEAATAKTRHDRDYMQGEQDKAKEAKRRYDDTKVWWDAEQAQLQAGIDKKKEDRDKDLDNAKDTVDAWKKRADALGAAYSIIEKIDSSHDKGAQLTKDQAAALEDAHKTIEAILPLLPQVSSKYSDVKTNIDTTHGAIKGSVQALWTKETPDSIPAKYKTGMDALDIQTRIALDWAKYNVWGNAFNDLRTFVVGELGKLAFAAGDAAYAAGQRIGNQLAAGIKSTYSSLSTAIAGSTGGATAGSGTAPYTPPGGGGGGVGSTTVNLTLSVQGAGLPTDQRVYDNIGEQLSRAVKRHMNLTGRGGAI